MGKPSLNYGCYQFMCHTILLAARHKQARCALTPASKAGTHDLPTPEGWKATQRLHPVVRRH